MTDVALRADGVRKTFGTTTALAGLDLVVRRGEVFGYLGPNGAGKSTTIKLALDLLRPTSGRMEVLGTSPGTGGAALRARIGYLPGELVMAPTSTARDLLDHLTRLRGGAGAARVGPLADRLGLDLGKAVRAMSKGTKQKVGVVQAFAHEPELLVLDEPTSGLDPLLQDEVHSLVREARDRGATVFLSSHALDEVQDVADRAAVLRAGRVVAVDAVAALRHRAGQRVELRFGDDVALADFATLPGVSDAALHGRTLTLLLRGSPDGVLHQAARHQVVGWSATDRELADLVLDYYRDEVRP